MIINLSKNNRFYYYEGSLLNFIGDRKFDTIIYKYKPNEIFNNDSAQQKIKEYLLTPHYEQLSLF